MLTMEEVIERPEVEARRRGGQWRQGVAVLVAVGFGLALGWLIWGSAGDEVGSDDAAAAPTYVTPGVDELTPRQEEMVDVVEQYVAAWSATDGDAAVSFMTDNGYVAYPQKGWRFDVADGALQGRITNGQYSTLRDLDPMLIYEHRIVLTGRIDGIRVSFLSVVEFTPAGDVQIISESIQYWGTTGRT